MSERQELSDVKAALLAARLRGQPLPQADAGAIGPRPAGAPSLASFGQERLWFLQQVNPHDAAYNMHTAVRLQGALDAERFAAALDLIVRRHAVLRSAFRIEGGRLVQTVTEQVPSVLAVEDLQNLPPDARLAAASQRATTLIRTLFDLEQAPLLRARLLRITPRDHLFVLVIHHIVADEWSIDILRRELAAVYNAPSLDAAVLPPFPVEYVDFAYWQRSRWEQGMYSPQLEYWRRQLEGELPPLQLPTDRPRPRVQRFRGAISRKALPDHLLPKLQAVAHTADSSLFMLLAAALDVLLFRWTGTHDLLVGTPIANRTQPELKQLAGFFLNTLVLRNQVNANQPFTALLSAVRETVLGAFAHQDLPLEKLVDELKPQRDPSYNPLFQVMLVYQKHVQPQLALDGLQAEPLQLYTGAAKLDLTLFVTETPNGWEAAWEYNSDLFDSASVERMLDQFIVLLEGIATNPGCTIGRLPLLPASEIALLQRHNETGAPYPRNLRIQDLIAAHCTAEPHAPALCSPGVTVSYADLDQRAQRLAARLRAHGVRPGALVPICAERSIDMIVGVLAILKAGGAYVPLDPSYPPARLAFMVEDAVQHAPGGCPLILAQRAFASLLGEFGLPLVYLGEGGELGAAFSDEVHEQIGSTAHDLAYVIYTSGSTGRPKGVMVTHANLVNSTVARELIYSDGVARFLLLSSFAFDSSLVGIFGTLCRGGTLILPPNRIEQDIAALAGMIAEESVTHLLCLPSLHELLLAYAAPGQLASLRTVIVAGEVCPRRLAQRHLAVLPGVQLYNEYGPTEATVWTTVYAVPDELPPGQIAIGKPIANVQVYVLDASEQPVPIGVAGELYIGGDNLAWGYLGQPALTEQRFPLLDNPLRPGQGPPLRLYRTGDLVRWRTDGYLDYLGRTDQQVKIRGNRVELEEIERALSDHPSISEAVVVARLPASVPAGLPAFDQDAATVANLVARLTRLESSTCEALLAETERLPVGGDAMPTAARDRGDKQ